MPTEKISLVMIVRNAEKTIERCLASVFDREVPAANEAVITLGGPSTDETVGILNRLATKWPITVYALDAETKARAFDGDELLDFSELRNFAHSKAKYLWHLWLDADDCLPTMTRVKAQLTIEDKEDRSEGKAMGLGDFVGSLPAQINVVWMPYHYLIEPETQRVLVSQKRERLLRWSDGFLWADPIHEHVVPTGGNRFTVENSAVLTQFWVEHRPDRPEGVREARNFAIMQRLEPLAEHRWRIAYYLGDHYAAASEFAKAKRFFHLATKTAGNFEERYLTWHNLFRMAWREGDRDTALTAASRCVAMDPKRAEGLADMVIYWHQLAQDPGACVKWYALYLESRPHELSMWATEIKLLPHMCALYSHAMIGSFAEGREAAERALAYEPRHPDVKNMLGIMGRLEAKNKAADAAKALFKYTIESGDRENAEVLAEALPAAIVEVAAVKRELEILRSPAAPVERLRRLDVSEYPDYVPQDCLCLVPGGEKDPTVAQWAERARVEGQRVALEDVWSFTRYVDLAEFSGVPLIVTTPRENASGGVGRLRSETPESFLVGLQRSLGDPDHSTMVYKEKVQMLLAHVTPGVTRTGPKVTIYAPAFIEHWAPNAADSVGSGASETQIAELAHWLSARGFRVSVYAAPPFAMADQGAIWRPAAEWDHRDETDLLICHRAPWIAHRPDIGAKRLYVWLHDAPETYAYTAFWGQARERVNRYVCLTNLMGDFYQGSFGITPSDPLIPYFLPECDLEPLPERLHDGPDVCYLSAPYRGLEYLLDMWPLIRSRVPEATLKLAYGWQVYDSMMQREAGELRRRKDAMVQRLGELSSEGVQWLDRLPQRKVRDLLDTSKVWAYPSSYPEMLCHVAMRAQARGVWPVVRNWMALTETVGGGRKVDFDPHDRAQTEHFAGIVADELQRPAMDAPRRALRDVALKWHEAAGAGWTRALTQDGLL